MKRCLLSIVLILVAACASVEPAFRIDGTTAETTREGVRLMAQPLDERARLDFATALMAIQFSQVRTAADVAEDPALQQMNYRLLGSRIAGLTYEDILELAAESPVQATITKPGR